MKNRIFPFFLFLFAGFQLSAQFSLPKLDYSYDALQPYIDSTTMRIHYTKHHAAYVNNLNAALQKHPEYAEKSIEELVSTINQLPEDIRTAVRNNGGGHYNHSLFWSIMASPDRIQTLDIKKIQIIIEQQFGSMENFKAEFEKAAAGRFGSGWAWLIVDADKKLKITSTGNQDNPLMDIAEVKGTPILALDVWEHAYYLNYQNKRADYIKAFWPLVDWFQVNKLYFEAIK